MKKRRYSDAADSSAGDDFHVLWTMRKCIELINFDVEALKAVAVENLSSEDNIYTGANPEMFLGVDLTEYYGGTNIGSAKKVIVSQLKYSTRKSTLNWTITNICKGKNGDYDGSIVHRLGSLYGELVKQIDPVILAEKLSINLVSNRPAGQELIDILFEIKTAIASFRLLNKKTTLANLKRNKPSNFIESIDILKSSSGLGADAFIGFISLLSLENCALPSRFENEQKLVKAITDFTSFNESQEYHYLNNLVNGKMLPENAKANVIRRSDVLLAFHMPDIDYVFPVPNEIEKPDQLVEREQLPEILKEISKKENSFLCLHGPAGIGKSTLMTSISENLPKGSVSVVLDCYGGGSYLDSDDGRHNYEQAITQICNELAISVGSNLLLKRNQDELFYIKELRRRMESAILILREFNKDALAVLIIDAADNSITAADKFETNSFISGILEMSLPDGCKVILSTRTGRVDSLGLSRKVKRIAIKPFELKETANFLLPRFPNVNDAEIEEFHRLTFGIPRVMVYTVELDGMSFADRMNIIKPDGKSLEDIFRMQIIQAETKSSEREVSVFLKRVISMPRPVPLHILVSVCELSEDKIHDIRTDLWSGMLFKDNKFSFRDEDLESYITTEYPTNLEDDQAVSQKLFELARNDGYASSHLGKFLVRADRGRELSEIVLNKLLLEYPQDPIRNKEVFIERTRLAMKSADKNNDIIDLLKLQVVAAEAAKTNKVLEDILLDSPELATSYGNLETNQKVYFQSGNPSWFGPAHLLNASIYAKSVETRELAKSHLKKVDEWLSYRNKLPVEDARDFQLSYVDIAFGMEAIFYLYGVDKAIEWIREWTPYSVSYRAIGVFLNNVLSGGPNKEIYEWIENHSKLRIDIKLMLAATFIRYGYGSPVKFSDFKASIPLLLRILPKAEVQIHTSLLWFCEYSLRDKSNYGDISMVLSAVPDYLPPRVPGFSDVSFRGDVEEPDVFFRIQAIRHLFTGCSYTPTDFFPKAVLEHKDDDGKKRTRKGEERTEFSRVYKHILPAYLARAKVITNAELADEGVQEAIAQSIAVFDDWEIGYYLSYRASALRKFIILKLNDIDFFSGNNQFTEGLVKNLKFKGTESVDLVISLGEKSSKRPELRPILPKLLTIAESLIVADILAGSEILKYYQRASIVASRFSSSLGKHYFDKMVQASNEIDLEAHDQIRVVSEIVKGNEFRNSPALANQFARYVTYCSEKLKGWDHFPWYAILPALNNLDFATSFARLCQWDDKGIRDWDRHFFELMATAVSNSHLSAEEAVAMFGMNRYQIPDLIPIYSKILAEVDDRKDSNLKNSIVEIISRDMTISFSPGNGLGAIMGFYDLISNGRFLDNKNVIELKQFIEKGEKLTPPKIDDIQKDETVKGENVAKYSNLVKSFCSGNENILRTAISEVRKGSKWVDFDSLFIAIAEEKVVERRLLILEELIKADIESISYYNFENGLSVLLNTWKENPEISKWKEGAFEKIIKSWFDIFFGHEYYSRDTVNKLGQILGIETEKVAGTLLKLLPDYLDEVSSQTLYQLLETTTQLLADDQKTEFLKWVVCRWNENLPNEFEKSVSSELVVNDDQVLTGVIRYFLGHPRKPLRWLAGHVVRRLVKMGNISILKNLLELQDAESCEPFQEKEHTYFWISAKLYLWIVFSRIANESPKSLLGFKEFILNEINNTQLPHALIKMHVRDAAIKLENYSPGFFSAEEFKNVKGILESKLNRVPRSNESRKRSNRSAGDTRFDFDSMDTLPYWYDHLGQTFNVSAAEVASLADKYISEKWGYVGNVRDDNHVTSREYYDMSNRHGSEPRVEDLSHYFEFHAMFCAAFDLLKTMPLIDSDTFYPRSWSEWLTQWGTYWDDRWLSDLRDPVLFNARYWRDKKSGSDWEWQITEDDFLEILGLGTEESIAVYQAGTIHFGKDYETISVRSGLVKPEFAMSLLRAMQTYESYDNHIPFEDDDEEDFDDDDSEKVEGFQIDGWIRILNNENRETDRFDPFVKEMAKEKLTPGKAFMQWSGAKISGDLRTTYLENNEDNWLTKVTRWSNTPRKVSYSDFTSDGFCLQIRSEVLLDFLKYLNKSLIIKVDIKRNLERSENEYYSPYSKIFLLESNGKVSTTTGDYKLR